MLLLYTFKFELGIQESLKQLRRQFVNEGKVSSGSDYGDSLEAVEGHKFLAELDGIT